MPRLRSLRQGVPRSCAQAGRARCVQSGRFDPEAEEKAAHKAKAHEEAEKVKAEAKAKLDKMLDQVEKLAD